MKTVFIIEGDGHDREALQALLTEHGYTVNVEDSRSLQVSEVTTVKPSPDLQLEEGEALARFRSDQDGKLYEVKHVKDATYEVSPPPHGQEQHYRDVYGNAPLGIFRSSIPGKLLSVNPFCARMLKFDSPQDMIETVNKAGIAQSLYLNADHRQEVLSQVLTSNDWHVFEERFRCKDGSALECFFHLRAVRDAEGRPIELEGFVEDVSERKRVERSLKFTQFAIDNAAIQSFWIDEQGRFFYANAAACDSLGYSGLEMTGMSIFDIDPDLTTEFFTRKWQELKRHGSGTFQRRHQNRDGYVFPVELRANYLVYEGREYVCFFATDISERRRNEEELRHTNNLLRATIEAAPTAIIGLDLEGTVRHVWNPAAEKMLGWSAEEAMGRPLPSVPQESQEEFRRFREWVGSGEPLDGIEVRRQRKDGTPVDYSIYAAPLKDRDERVIGNIAVLVEVTERKRAEEELWLSQFMIDRAALGIFRGSEDARILFVNDYWARRLGYTPEELCTKTFFDLDPCLTPEFWQAHREKVVANGINTFESVHRCKDGSEIPVEVTVNLLKYRGQIYSCSFAKDISERQAADRALRQASLIVENSPVVLFRWRATEGWPVEMVSGNVARFGYTQEDLLSGAVPFADLVHPEDLQRVAAEVEEHTRHGEERFQQEYRIVTKDKEVRWIDDRTVVELDAAGEVTHYQGILIDITEQKRTERVIAARMRLLQFAATHTLEDLLEATLNEVEKLTGSQIGFYHFLEDDQQTLSLQSWSSRTLSEFCTAQGKGLHYPVSQAGVWVDCIHQRRPVIHDDYAALPHRKGLPAGHAQVQRELVVPVFRGDKIVAILGVGNKPSSYTSQDEETVSLLADLAWSIVESKRAEQALQESERRYRSIVEHAPFGITHSTRDGKLLSANPALASILKYDSAQELMETINRSSIQDVLFPKPSMREPLVEDILSSDSWSVFNNRLRCKDGSFVTCRVHSRRILDEDGQANKFESFQENISDQLAAEQALRESEEKFRVLAETSSVAICLFQGEHYIYVNPAMERLFGYSGEEWGRLKFWDWAHEDCREQIRRRGMARLAGQPVTDQFEARYLTKSGEDGYVLVSAGMMEYQGRPTGVASFLDITERKRAEELVRASLEEKEVLLREIHHRVKNNLQVVSSLLFLQSQKFDDAELQTCFLDSQSRICSMALAHEQLYQSKNLAEISVQGYVESLVGQLRQIFSHPGQRIDCRLAVEDIELDIEKVVPCGLLITELLSNAYKHAFGAGRSGQVTISLKSSAGQIELAVADDGVGLPEGLDYRRAKTLGLQLVTALTNQLNGTLDHDGSSGTRFRVRFAASEPLQRS